MEEKICSICGAKYKKPTKYCGRKCYDLSPRSEDTRIKMSKASKGKPKSQHMRDALSKTTLGKPKPWSQGDRNPNYGGKNFDTSEKKKKFIEAVKLRGQPWTDKHKAAHSIKMFGSSNAMRGKEHTPEFKIKMSELKKQQYKDGYIKVSSNKISKLEKEIISALRNDGYTVCGQFHIPGVSYWYDIYLPDFNLIIEYNGDYWHANPNKYPSGTLLPIWRKGPTLVDNIWERDKLKKEAAILNGYRIETVWESDYKKHGIGIIKCLMME